MKQSDKPLRGRPRAFDRQGALNEALQVFWRHGYESASIAHLTDAMQINPPSLYAAFGSKEKLYEEAINLYLSNHADYVTQSLEQEPTARSAVARIFKESAKAFCLPGMPRGCLIGSGMLYSSRDNSSIGQLLTKLRTQTRSAIQLRIETAIKAGEVPADTDAKALASYFSATIQGMSVQAIDGASLKLLNRIAEIAMKSWPGRTGYLESKK